MTGQYDNIQYKMYSSQKVRHGIARMLIIQLRSSMCILYLTDEWPEDLVAFCEYRINGRPHKSIRIGNIVCIGEWPKEKKLCHFYSETYHFYCSFDRAFSVTGPLLE